MDTINNFEKNKYTIIKSALDKDFVQLVSQYAIFDELSNFSPGDPQVADAHSSYADPLMESLLLKMQPVIEQHTGLELYPTYSYYRIYRNGQYLRRHLDRESCEISATLALDYNYPGDPWELFIDGEPIYLCSGDMAVYKGCELSHWRNTLNCLDNEYHIQVFLHYVNKYGKFSNLKYDEREFIGFPQKNKKDKKYIIYTS